MITHAQNRHIDIHTSWVLGGAGSIVVCSIGCHIDDTYRQDEFTGGGDDSARTAVIGQDGGVVIAGTYSYDFQVIKLDANGTLAWRFQVSLDYSFPRIPPP